jgi:tetratricopeptide (TPR) repeat protein
LDDFDNEVIITSSNYEELLNKIIETNKRAIQSQILGDTLEDAGKWISFAESFSLRLDTEASEAKNAALRAKAIYDANEGDHTVEMLRISRTLATVALKAEYDNETALQYCNNAWEMAKKVGFEKLDPNLIFDITNIGQNSTVPTTNLWFERAMETSTELLEKGATAYDVARIYVTAGLAYYIKNLGALNKRQNKRWALECLEIIESSSECHIRVLCTASWFASFVLTKEPTWPLKCDTTRKTVRMLNRTIKHLQSPGNIESYLGEYRKLNDIINNDIMRGSAKGLLADYHLESGAPEQALSEYREAITILSNYFVEKNFLNHYEVGIEKALRA